MKKLKALYQLLRDTVKAFLAGDFVSQGAALSYYTFFAIAPLFIIVLAIAGIWFGPEAARKELFGQVNQLVGKEGGEAIQGLVAAANKPNTGIWAACIAFGTLLVASTTVFAQLQGSLNKIWNVRTKEGRGLYYFMRHRLLSFAMILVVSFLLIVSLILSAGLGAVANFMGELLSAKAIALEIVNFVGSLAVITVMFAMIFKWLPDIKLEWRNVWLGGLVTAFLFNIGKFLLGLYVGRSGFASVYGAAGSLVIVLIWVYYSAQILFFGAQLTRIHASHHGSKPRPLRGAEFIPTAENHPKHSRRD